MTHLEIERCPMGGDAGGVLRSPGECCTLEGKPFCEALRTLGITEVPDIPNVRKMTAECAVDFSAVLLRIARRWPVREARRRPTDHGKLHAAATTLVLAAEWFKRVGEDDFGARMHG